MSNPKGGLVLTRRVGEAVRLLRKSDGQTFTLEVISLQTSSTTIFTSFNSGFYDTVELPVGADLDLFGGKIEIGRGPNGGQQVRLRFMMSDDIDIVRTELIE